MYATALRDKVSMLIAWINETIFYFKSMYNWIAE